MRKVFKKAMPHVWLTDKGHADLYFELLNKDDRKAIVDDLDAGNKVSLPDYGKIETHSLGPTITINNEVKDFKKEDLPKKMWSEDSEKYLKMVIEKMGEPAIPVMEYDNQEHKYKMKTKYNIEKMIKEFVDQQMKKEHPIRN